MMVRLTKMMLAAALVCTLCLPAAAAQPIGSELTGKVWNQSTQDEKLAFLYGVSNVVAIEHLISQKDGSKPTPFVSAWITAFGEANWTEIANKLNAWYTAHPDQANRGVFDVLWYEFMVPAAR